MKIESIETSALEIPFREAFRHASAERTAMQSLWAEARSSDGAVGFGEGCPREYVTHETLTSAMAFVDRHRATWRSEICGIESLQSYVQRERREIDVHPAAWSAVEIALLDVIGKSTGRTIEALLEVAVPSGVLRYSAVLGDTSEATFIAQLDRYCRSGFDSFKVKLSGDAGRDASKVRALTAAGIDPLWVRADANNLFPNAAVAISHLEALQFPFSAIEEPLRTGDYDAMRHVSVALGMPIILDESVLRVRQLELLCGDTDRWIVNLRVSKMGGIIRSIEFARAAAQHGIRLILGAHVGETSVLTRAAIVVASVVAPSLVAQEGAFGTHLLERDVVRSPLMFGPGGALDVEGRFVAPGLGLEHAPSWPSG